MTKPEAMEQAWAAITAIPRGDFYHDRLQECVADLMLHTQDQTAKRCAEIADRGMFSSLQSIAVANEIRAEFGVTEES